MFLFDPSYRPILIFLAVLGLFALFRFVRQRWFTDPGVDFSDDDAGHRQAVQLARASLDEFWTALRRPAAPGTEFGLKIGLPAGQGTEHVWVLADGRTESSQSGKLMSRPRYLKLREGERIQFEPDQISDWMIRDATGTRGAYTIQAMLRTLPPHEARRMADEQGVVLQD